MAHSIDQGQNLIDHLAEEFVARLRGGEVPSIAEYAERYPELSERIRALFPTLVLMEQLKPGSFDSFEGVLSAAGRTSESAAAQLGDFRVIREVGRGGMGVVYEAEQVSLGRRVALKVLPKRFLRDELQRKRFQREARAAARLHHTNIVPVFGVGEQEGVLYYVMQFIQGQGLDDVLLELKRLRKSGAWSAADKFNQGDAAGVAQALVTGVFRQDSGGSGTDQEPAATVALAASEVVPQVAAPASAHETAVEPAAETLSQSGAERLVGKCGSSGPNGSRRLYWQSVARIGQQVAQALQYAHEQKTIHRDVKPANLLLDTRGTVWVTDFGLAKAQDQQDLTQTGDVLGTLRYMAPEQFHGRGDERSDVYSLGITLYELLVLRPAYEGTDRGQLVQKVLHDPPPRLRAIDPSIPRDLETIVQKSIDRDPAHRYGTAQALADDLQRYLADEPIRARRLSWLAQSVRWCRRHIAITFLASTILALIVFAAVGSTVAAIRLGRILNHDRLLLAQTEYLRGQSLCEQGEVDVGLLWMARSLVTAESVPDKDSQAWRRVIRINLESYRRNANSLTGVIVHSPKTSYVVVNRVGGRVATTSDDSRGRRSHLVRLWDAGTAQLLHELSHGGPVSEITFSPNGKWILTRGQSGLQLWTAAGEPIELPFMNRGCTTAEFTGDSSQLAAAGPWGIWLWSPDIADRPARLLAQAAEVRSLTFSPDGARLATYSSDGSLLIWDTNAGTVLGEPISCRLGLGPQSYPRLTFSPHGTALVIDDSNANLIDVNSRQVVDFPHDSGPRSVARIARSRSIKDEPVLAHIAFSQDGCLLATCGRDRTVRIWDAATFRPLGPALTCSSDPEEAAFSPDGTRLLVRAGNYLQIWDYGNDRTLGQRMPWSRHAWWITNDRLLTVSGGAFLWNVPHGQRVQTPIYRRNAVHKVAFWPDGTTIAVADTGGLHVLGRSDWPRGIRFMTVNAALSSQSSHAVLVGFFSDKHGSIAPSSLFFVNKDLNTYTRLPPHDPGEPFPVAISTYGRRAVSFCPATRNSQLWDVGACRPIDKPQRHPLPAWGLAIHPNEQSYVTACMDGSLRRYSAETGEFMEEVARVFPPPSCLAYSSRGSLLAAGSASDVRLLSDSTGAPVGRVLPHPTVVSALAFGSDDATVVSACQDGGIRVWDVATGESLGPTLWHDDIVRDVACSGDGQQLLSGGDDLTIRRWIMPQPLMGTPAELTRQIEVLTGKELLGDGTIRLLECQEWAQRQAKSPK